MLSLASNSSPRSCSWSPAQTFLTRRVNLGPISCMSTPSQPSLKMQRWWRKKMKSRWLWKVTTLLPLNSGCCGKREARRRPTLTPTFESKLLRISSGTCSVATAWCLICFWYCTLVILKTASMPSRWRTSSSQPLEQRSTMTCVQLRVLAQRQTSSSFISLRGQKATLWKTIMISLRKAQILTGGLSCVVIRIFTGASLLRMLLNSSNMASSYSSANSSPPSCLSSMVTGLCRSSSGSFLRSLRSFIWIWFLMTFRFQCTSTRFCLFLISLGCFLKAVANSSMLLGLARTGLLFCLASPISSLCDFALAFFTIVDNYIISQALVLPLLSPLPPLPIILIMQSTFANREIVWAKVKGYPWWPAEIAKLPSPDHNVFKVVFVAEDTHAFLNPRDVRKYAEFYEECSKKKMRGLAPAIQAADELFKKRTESIPKTTRSPQKGKAKSSKSKPIKKTAPRDPLRESSEEEELQSIAEEAEEQRGRVSRERSVKEEKGESVREDSSNSIEESMEEQKFLNESEEKVDRSKIEALQESIYRHIEEIKQGSYKLSMEHYKQIAGSLSDEQLLQSKVTNMLSFIIHSLRKEQGKEKEELRQLVALQKQLKERIMRHLNDTSYYDQYLKLIQRNKKNRSDYENRLIYYLKTAYKIKKELALIFAARLMSEINNGAVVREKELLEDIKERRVQLSGVSNKAAIDRNIENMIPKYM